LKRGGVTVYLCLPAGRMASHANWRRGVIDLALLASEGGKATGPAPVLVVLDEFPVLGYIKGVETAPGQIAGFGVKLRTIIQDITQLQREYRHSRETFVGNAGAITAFA
jgi:type IV secretion system protein VirD4